MRRIKDSKNWLTVTKRIAVKINVLRSSVHTGTHLALDIALQSAGIGGIDVYHRSDLYGLAIHRLLDLESELDFIESI